MKLNEINFDLLSDQELISLCLKYKIIEKEKLSQIKIIRPDGFLLWCHVASIGEAMSILPLVEELKKYEKIKKILITSITLSSSKVLEKKYENDSKIFHQFLPLDVPIFVNNFLNHWKPDLSIFIDSEIWPNLVTAIKRKNIPFRSFEIKKRNEKTT